MRSSRNSWIWCSGTSLMQFNLLISAELWRVCTIPTLWSVPMPSPGPRGRSPPRQWHFLPWNQRLPGVFSKSSDSCVLSNSLAGVIPSSSLLPMHWDLSPHTRASCCPLVQILALASNCCEMQPERGNVPYLHSHLLRKAVLKLCPSLPGPAQHGFSVWRHYDYFYFLYFQCSFKCHWKSTNFGRNQLNHYRENRAHRFPGILLPELQI